VDKKPSARKLGANIKRLRLDKKMSQSDLCKRIAADRSYVSNLENGRKNPTLATIEKIARAFNVSVDELLK